MAADLILVLEGRVQVWELTPIPITLHLVRWKDALPLGPSLMTRFPLSRGLWGPL